MSLEYIASICQTTKLSAHKSIQRLEAKGLIVRTEFKNGRGGWTRYELPESVYQDILHNENFSNLRTNLGQMQDKVGAQLRTELRTTGSSSSSSNNIYKNTTTEEDSFISTVVESSALPPEWQEVNIEQLSPIGFTVTHLTQLAKSNKLPPAIVQDSIYAFAFDLEHNGKAKSIKVNPINFFMGILRSGQPYAAPGNYESPSDRSMRLYLEKKRADEQRKAAMEAELLETEFNEWSSSLTPEEKEQLLPLHILNQKHMSPKIAHLRTYYRDNVWPEKKNEIMKMLSA